MKACVCVRSKADHACHVHAGLGDRCEHKLEEELQRTATIEGGNATGLPLVRAGCDASVAMHTHIAYMHTSIRSHVCMGMQALSGR